MLRTKKLKKLVFIWIWVNYVTSVKEKEISNHISLKFFAVHFKIEDQLIRHSPYWGSGVGNTSSCWPRLMESHANRLSENNSCRGKFQAEAFFGSWCPSFVRSALYLYIPIPPTSEVSFCGTPWGLSDIIDPAAVATFLFCAWKWVERVAEVCAPCLKRKFILRGSCWRIRSRRQI